MDNIDITGFDIEAFVDGYIECILWCDCQWAEEDQDPSGESGGREGLELREGVRDGIIEAGQLREFVAGNLADLLLYCEQRFDVGNIPHADPRIDPAEAYAGHDFYLTRAGHGAGFWDRGLGELGDRLTEASKAAGSPDDHMLFDCGDGTVSL